MSANPLPQPPFEPSLNSVSFNTPSQDFFEYLAALNFQHDDLVCIGRGPDKRLKAKDWKNNFVRFDSIEQDTFDQFAQFNRDGKNIYLSMATFLPGTLKRTKQQVQSVRHVFVEADDNGAEVLQHICADIKARVVPPYAVVIESSTGRVQVIWNVSSDDFTADGKPDITKHEALLDALQRRYQTDAAAKDTARFLRLPGFQNVNHDAKPVARVIAIGDKTAHRVTDFKIAETPATATVTPFVVKEIDCTVDGPPIPYDTHDDTLTSIVGKIHREHPEKTVAELADILTAICERRCTGHGSDYREMCEKVAASIGAKKDRDERVFIGGVPAGSNPHVASRKVPAIESQPVVTMSEEEEQAEIEKEYPVIPLTGQVGPEWDDSIFYGPAGRVVRKAVEYSEGHPVGMLLDFLVAIGSIVGRGPHFRVGATIHYANEYLCKVGLTGRGRKGMSRAAIKEPLRLIDSGWSQRRVLKGFGSSEAIVYSVRDAKAEQHQMPGKDKFETRKDPGEPDKRMLIEEDEIASIFQLCSKKESRADIIIRDAWDGLPLMNIVKGKSADGMNNSCRCDEPHISISGDTTKSELMRKMPDGSDANGFGNRFLFCFVYRTKLCPNGGPPIDWMEDAKYFWDVIAFAKTVKLVSMSKAARQWWNRIYQQLEEALPGMAGSMTARAAPHVKRLAMIYALIDQSSEIQLEHFLAAHQLWEYCRESAIYVFGGTTKPQVKLLDWLRQNGPATAVDVTQRCFHKHETAKWVQQRLDELTERRELSQDGDKYRVRAA